MTGIPPHNQFSQPMAAVYQATALKKEHDGGRVKALRGVDFTLTHGEFVAITGPSGCGKTSLLQILGALDRPSSGTLHYRGQSIPDLPDPSVYRSHQIGFIFQSFHLLPTFTAIENVQLPMFETEVTASQRLERARAIGIELHEKAVDVGREHRLGDRIVAA